MERAAKLAQVFNTDVNLNSFDSGIKEFFDKLEKLLVNELKIWCDQNSLKTYVERKMESD